MLANALASILSDEFRKTDVSGWAFADIAERFERLRGYRLLPTGRTKNVTHLSPAEIVAGILSAVTVKPGFAGLAAHTLIRLNPVGGPSASFHGGETLGQSLQALVTNSEALSDLIEVRISDSEMYTNAHGRAAITYQSDGTVFTAYYVSPNASSLLQPGAEVTFNPRSLVSSAVTETVLYAPIFKRLAVSLKREASMPRVVLPVPAEDDDEEIQKEKRAKRLGLTRGSSFLNIGVDNQVTWPSEETVVQFEGRRFVLLPKTRENTTSIHIDLHGQKVSAEEAITLINRFLSLMTWCDDQFAIQQEGWSGNPEPTPVPKRNLAFTTAYQWIFDRKIPHSEDAKRALALYREGRNAEQNYLISYAVLSYYKILEIKYPDEDEKVRKWIADNFSVLKADKSLAEDIAKLEKACREKEPPLEPPLYISKACRIAVAHASANYPSDPDQFNELRRLHGAAHIIRALARHFISSELAISDCFFDGS